MYGFARGGGEGGGVSVRARLKSGVRMDSRGPSLKTGPYGL